jgi:hypothetical protein
MQRLVTAHVEGAQRRAPTAHRDRDRPVHGLLLFDARRPLPMHEQELGAHQAGLLGARGDRGVSVGHRAEVRRDRDLAPVARASRQPRRPEILRGVATLLAGPVPENGGHGGGRVEHQLAGAAVQRDRRPLGERQHPRTSSDDGRDAAGPGQNGRV